MSDHQDDISGQWLSRPLEGFLSGYTYGFSVAVTVSGYALVLTGAIESAIE